MGLDTLKIQSELENSIKVDLNGLPSETISFLSSPQGQIMVRNTLLTFTTDMGNGISIPSPIPPQTAPQNHVLRQYRETNMIQQVPCDTKKLDVPNNNIEKISIIVEDFDSEVDTELERELMEMEKASLEVSSTTDDITEVSSVEKKSKFEKWKKRGDIGRS